MKISGAIIGLAAFIGLLAYGCSGSDSHVVQAGGSAGEAGQGGAGESSTSGGGDTGGATAGSSGASAGFSGSGAGAAAGQSGGPGAGGSSEGGASGNPSAEGGAAGASEPSTQIVNGFGCFAVSGDGWDFLLNGERAPIITAATESACGLEVSNNVDGFAPEVTPTSFVMRRRFVLDASIANAATFTVSFAADDAVDFVLNGQSVASCTPPSGNIGECSSGCHAVVIPSTALLGAGQTNTLEITVTNLLSVDAGNGNFGWTGLGYSICAASR